MFVILPLHVAGPINLLLYIARVLFMQHRRKYVCIENYEYDVGFRSYLTIARRAHVYRIVPASSRMIGASLIKTRFARSRRRGVVIVVFAVIIIIVTGISTTVVYVELVLRL